MWKRWTLAGLLAAGTLTVGALPVRSQNQTAGAKPGSAEAPPAIVVTKCAIKLMKEVILSAERPGILGDVDVEEGDEVAEGKLLAKIKDDVPKATLAIAQKESESDIDIRYATKAAEVAQVEFEKAEAANRVKKGTVPEVEVRRAELAARKAELEIEKAQHVHEVNVLKRNEADVQVQTCRIDAPFAGFVTKVHLTKGAAVRQGDPVIELVSTANVKVEGHVSLEEALLLTPGMPVEIDVVLNAGANPLAVSAQPTKVPGVLKFVDVKATAGDHKVRVWAEVPNTERHRKLIAGLNAKMTIPLPERPQVALPMDEKPKE